MKWLLFILLLGSPLAAKPPECVVFDFGKVVAHVDRRPALEFLSNSLGVPYEKVKKGFSKDKLYKALTKDKGYWEDYAGRALDHEWEKQFEVAKRAVIRYIPGMRELIRDLKSQGIKVVLLSNTGKHRGRFIRELGGYELFETVCLSSEIKMKKPDKEAYKVLLEKVGFEPAQCFFVDDKLKNVKTACEVGMKGVLFEGVSALNELLQLEFCDLARCD